MKYRLLVTFMKKLLRLGSRGSPLALIQAEEVKRRLLSEPDFAREFEVQIVPILTSGDWKPEHKERRFIEMGGNKGLFTKEIEESLFTKQIDMAVHSMKDLANCLPLGLEIGAILEREDPREAFISHKAPTLDELPSGAVVGTSSLRRQAQILARRPDLKVTALRGNVGTRLQKLADGIADATILAVAGLSRLGFTDRITSIIPTDVILPAGAQGSIGIEIRSDDSEMRKIASKLNVDSSARCIRAERAMLCTLDGSCQTPIGAMAKLNGNRLDLEGVAARPDGTGFLKIVHSGDAGDPEAIGNELGHKFRSELPADFFSY